MDPLTHSLFGIAAACAIERRKEFRRGAALAGLAGALIPDADVLLRSAADPLFTLEYHRHFTHSALLSPLLGLLAAGVAISLRRAFRVRDVPAGRMWLAAWAAVLSHLFCDAWTSYGTHVFWPFSGGRVSLDWISIIDPVLTVPMAACVALCVRYANRRAAVTALCWVAIYLGFCNVQRFRAHRAMETHLAAVAPDARPARISLKPAFGNVIVWRGMSVRDGEFSAMAIRCPLTGGAEVIPGGRVTMFSSPEAAAAAVGLPADSLQARDIARFFRFSDGWIGLHPADPLVVGDLRYSAMPDDVHPLWGIRIDPSAPEAHVAFETFRSNARPSIARLLDMVRGETLREGPVVPVPPNSPAMPEREDSEREDSP